MEIQLRKEIHQVISEADYKSDAIIFFKKRKHITKVFKVKLKLFFRKLKPNHWMDGIENFKITLKEFNPNKK